MRKKQARQYNTLIRHGDAICHRELRDRPAILEYWEAAKAEGAQAIIAAVSVLEDARDSFSHCRYEPVQHGDRFFPRDTWRGSVPLGYTHGFIYKDICRVVCQELEAFTNGGVRFCPPQEDRQ